jgi:hypothetical protein
MKVRRSGPAGVAGVGDVLAGCDLVADGGVVAGVVAIRVAEAVGVLDGDPDAAVRAIVRWS